MRSTIHADVDGGLESSAGAGQQQGVTDEVVSAAGAPAGLTG
jgi:hypothetical protein